jgi:hypothetical protein
MNNLIKLNKQLTKDINVLNKIKIKKSSFDLSSSEYELIHLCLIKRCKLSEENSFKILYKIRKCLNTKKIYKLSTLVTITNINNNNCKLNSYLKFNNFKKLNTKTINTIYNYCK